MKLQTDPEKWIILNQVDSTNSYALRNRSLPSGTVIIAREQTAGRGRMGRKWHSMAGDAFLFTGIIHLRSSEFPFERLGYLPLIAGLSVIRACRNIRVKSGDNVEFSLKWPNDVYMRSSNGPTGKLAGILIETEFQDEHNLRCIIGIGLNWRGAVPEVDDGAIPPVSLFSETQRDAVDFASPLINNLNSLLENISDSRIVLDEIRDCFYLQNKMVSLSNVKYRVEGMNEDGGLLLRSLINDETRVLHDTSEKITVMNN